jgi:hypothetical protein
MVDTSRACDAAETSLAARRPSPETHPGYRDEPEYRGQRVDRFHGVRRVV